MYQNINAKPTPNGVIHIIKLYWCLFLINFKASTKNRIQYLLIPIFENISFPNQLINKFTATGIV